MTDSEKIIECNNILESINAWRRKIFIPPPQDEMRIVEYFNDRYFSYSPPKTKGLYYICLNFYRISSKVPQLVKDLAEFGKENIDGFQWKGSGRFSYSDVCRHRPSDEFTDQERKEYMDSKVNHIKLFMKSLKK